MADLPSSKKKIQVEETQYKSAVSESTAQKMGGAINHILDNSVNQIGDVVISHLSVSAFQARRGNNWVLMSGQSIVGSDLDVEEGISSLPDATGNSAFLRQGASLGSYQANQNKSHTHTYSETPATSVGAGSGNTASGGNVSVGFSSTSNTGAEGGSEARPNNYQMNFFIKINNDPT